MSPASARQQPQSRHSRRCGDARAEMRSERVREITVAAIGVRPVHYAVVRERLQPPPIRHVYVVRPWFSAATKSMSRAVPPSLRRTAALAGS